MSAGSVRSGSGRGESGRGESVRKVLAIGGVGLRRMLRDRSNLFYVFVFPVVLILVIGLQFGEGDDPRLGVVAGGNGELTEAFVDAVEAREVTVVRVGDVSELVDRVESRELDAGVSLPPDLDAAVPAGERTTAGFVAGATTVGQQLRLVVEQSIVRVTAVPVAVAAVVERGADAAEASAAAIGAAGLLDAIEVRTVTAGDRLFPEDLGQYDVAAPSQLVLFVFLTGLTGATALVQTRRLGLSARMLATPTSVTAVVAGEAVGRFLVALVQGVYVLLATLVVFRVDWGDPLGAALVVIAVAAVSAAAAMLFGTLFGNPEQAAGVGVVVSLVVAALGGAMVPVELFSDTLTGVARLTPHYWAIDAFAELVRHDGTVVDVAPQLGVLAAYAAVLLLLASWRMRAVITGR